MKYLVLILTMTALSACQAAPILVPAGIGAAAALSLEANKPAVDKFGEKYFKAE